MKLYEIVNKFIEDNTTKESFIKSFNEAKYTVDSGIVKIIVENTLVRKNFDVIDWLIELGYDIVKNLNTLVIIEVIRDLNVLKYLHKNNVTKKQLIDMGYYRYITKEYYMFLKPVFDMTKAELVLSSEKNIDIMCNDVRYFLKLFDEYDKQFNTIDKLTKRIKEIENIKLSENGSKLVDKSELDHYKFMKIYNYNNEIKKILIRTY